MDYVADFFRMDRDLSFKNNSLVGVDIPEIRSALFLQYKVETVNDLNVYIGTHPEKPKKSCIRLTRPNDGNPGISRLTMERPAYNGVYVIGIRVRWDSKSEVKKVKNIVGISLAGYSFPNMDFEDGVTYSIEYGWASGSYHLFVDGVSVYTAGSPTVFVPKMAVGTIVAGEDSPLNYGDITITDIYCYGANAVADRDRKEYLQGPLEVEHYTPTSVENAQAWKVVDGTPYARVKTDKSIIEALTENTMRAAPADQRNVMTGPLNNRATFRFTIPDTGDILGYIQSAALRKPDGQSGSVTFNTFSTLGTMLGTQMIISATSDSEYTRLAPRVSVQNSVTQYVLDRMDVFKS